MAELILSIQNGEAGLNLGIDDQPDLLDIIHAYRSGGFWVALDRRDRIVGSIGLLVYGQSGVLKKFFVAMEYRGRGGPAHFLFGNLLDRALALSLSDIVLDTPAVATRSHAFYERNGFKRIEAGELPPSYLYPDRDSIFYRMESLGHT